MNGHTPAHIAVVHNEKKVYVFLFCKIKAFYTMVVNLMFRPPQGCANEAKLLVQHHQALWDATCWPRLNAMLDNVGLSISLVTTLEQHFWANNVLRFCLCLYRHLRKCCCETRGGSRIFRTLVKFFLHRGELPPQRGGACLSLKGGYACGHAKTLHPVLQKGVTGT